MCEFDPSRPASHSSVRPGLPGNGRTGRHPGWHSNWSPDSRFAVAKAQIAESPPASAAEISVCGGYRRRTPSIATATRRQRGVNQARGIHASAPHETPCRHPSIRYAVVIKDADEHVTIAAATAGPRLSVEDRACHQAIIDRFGAATVAPLLVVAVDRMPLTEQGKPNRAAIKQLAHRLLAA